MSIKPLTVSNQEIANDRPKSALNADIASGVSAISVYSISKFAINKIILIGEFGSESSEIVKTSASVAPSGETVSLASALVKSHPKDTPVYIIPYDQIEISHADSIAGSKTVLDLQDLDPEMLVTLFDDTTSTDGYYFFRYKNSIDGTFSSYSDPVPYLGYASNTVGYAIQWALTFSGKTTSELLTPELLIEELNEMLRYVRGELKGWSDFQHFDTYLGSLALGSDSVDMPDDAYDQNSNRSVDAVRIDGKGELTWTDKEDMDELKAGLVRTTVLSSAIIGDTTLSLSSTVGLPEEGSVRVYHSGSEYVIEYGSNDQDTGTLGSIPASGDGSITSNLSSGDVVLYNALYGQPTRYTIYGGKVYFDRFPDEANSRVLMDYYSDITEVDSEADVLTGSRMDMAKHWLLWVIDAITENRGKKELNHPDFVLFNNIVRKAKRQENSRTGRGWKLRVRGINYRTRSFEE